MKRIYSIVLFSFLLANGMAQDFDKNIASARSSYASGDLSNARFAMEQMLSDLDRVIGKEILAMLPTSMGTMASLPKEDNVTGGSGVATGLFVHRRYGKEERDVNLEIINNSPLINSLNTIITSPLIGGMMRNENQKVVKVQGYKSLVQRDDAGNGKFNYELQIPFNNTLLTLKVKDSNEEEILKFGDTLPLAKIAQAAQ